MTNQIPRPEYPRPQFVRNEWLCLNGPWQFEADPGDSRDVSMCVVSGLIAFPPR